MKNSRTIIYVVILQFVFLSAVSLGQTETPENKVGAAVTEDTQLKLKLINDNWKIDVQVSFNGNEGKMGKLKIFNSSKQLVTEFEIELKKFPEYYTVNLNEFANDTYVFELTTDSAVHTSNLIIK